MANAVKRGPAFKRPHVNGVDFDYRNHAETLALKYARVGDTIEVIRFTVSGRICMAKPCEHCQQALRKAGIKKVRYTDENGNWKIWRA